MLTSPSQLRERKGNRVVEEDKHSERHQRRAAEDLRSYMKRLDPPVSVDDSYDQVKARITHSDEYQALSSEDARRTVYDKHIRRLKEKDAEGDRLRRKDRGDDGHRDRGERSHRSAGRRSRTRTPDRDRERERERDVFEADRKRAIEVRERNFRKSSMAESLLSDRRSVDSPYDSVRDRDRERDRDHRDRDRDRRGDRDRRDSRDRERDRDYDRRPRHRGDDRDDFNHYDRERRTREEDRERFHNRRRVTADRDVDELPYGDERPTSSSQRRPRAADENDGRSSKRVKLEDTAAATREPTPHRDAAAAAARQGTRTPQQAPQREKEKAKSPTVSVRAGSEEGEIEED